MGARNPKEIRFPVSLTGEVNSRLEALADAAGANKTVMAAIALSAGVAQLEILYRLAKVEPYLGAAVNAAAAEKVSELNQTLSRLKS